MHARSAGADFRVAVHELDHLQRRFRVLTIADAMVNVNGTQTAKDADTKSVIALGPNGFVVGSKAAGSVALCTLAGDGIVRDFRSLIAALFVSPAAEAARGLNGSGKGRKAEGPFFLSVKCRIVV